MPRSLNRRRFISQSAAGGAAAGLVISATSAASAAPTDQLVVAVMGLSRGRNLARTFSKQPGVELKYVCDVDTQRLAGCAKGIEEDVGQAPQTVTDFRRVLDDKSVDVLVCAAPNHWHGPATILACQAGKHVYVEKPCSHNPREGELMAAAAVKHNRAVQVGTQRRSGPDHSICFCPTESSGRAGASLTYHDRPIVRDGVSKAVEVAAIEVTQADHSR